MAHNVKEGEGIILIPRGDANEIEIIVVKRPGFIKRALAAIFGVVTLILSALVAGAASGFGDALAQLFR